ncbi:hypothetical protein C7T94_05945 [Pedobacter yulinensis]|uniref:Radical SAM core domain-containing protein n=1 Tax=Pedobacter yulinensis TaxID=2126353 RepID=A0A2T3HPF0_9SPHI|nr:radical SAM protein [Pedobacter yulinensis]PST84261.1 hypothetical protein C7T94_05945 [Pedobacter yulinensis]
MENLFKTNPYNILIQPDESDEFLLFNTLTGGIEILDQEEGFLMAELQTLACFDGATRAENPGFFERMLAKEYLIRQEVDIVAFFESHTDKTQFKKAGIINLTIGTTITCNMGCAYCFEFVKPNHTLKDLRVKEQIPRYIEQIIRNDKMNHIHTLSVTWYGGEPLINVAAITDLSVGLLALAEKYKLEYAANIITNGIYLTPENIQKLVDYRVNSVQVTIDGARDVHDRKRPLKQKNAENYFRILRNLAGIPKSIDVNVRVNVDKEVAASVETMLDDFHVWGLWPQKYEHFHFDPAWLRSYEEISLTEDEKDTRMFVDEFFEFKQKFRLSLTERFNAWSQITGNRKARLKWDLPSYQSTCATWASPISLVVDPNGNIHKCWETIHDDTKAPSTVFDAYDPEIYASYSSFNRYNHNVVCRNCKYLPVCDKISCSYDALKNSVPQCTEWKYKAEHYIGQQYVMMRDTPEKIGVPQAADAVNTGHSNK